MNPSEAKQNMPKAISYIRFSSGTQAKGSTKERQNALISEWLMKHPQIGLSDLSQADLGRSGYTGKHLDHGLGKLISAIGEGRITEGDFILVEAIDRIGRLLPSDMMKLIQTIVESGVKIVTLEDNQEYSKLGLDTNPSAFFILIGKIQQAHDYSKNLSRRLSAAYESKRKKAKRGEPIRIATSFWLTSEGKLIPEKAKFVEECIALYLKGYGTRRILMELMKEYNFAKDIHPTTVKRWLTNKALIGVWQNKGDEISGVFEPLIDTTTFYKIQSEFQRRRTEMSPEETYELSGLAICERCSARYYYRRKKHKDSVIIYANCSTYLKRGANHCPNNRMWPYEVLLAIFEATYQDTLSNKAWNYSLVKLGEELEAARTQLAEVENIKNKIVDFLMSTNDPNDAVLQQRYKDAQEKESKISETIALLEARLKSETAEPAKVIKSSELDAMQMAEANEHIKSVESDWVHLRDYLKKCGYQIVINGDFAWVSTTSGRIRYSVKKRSQMYGCYIVEVLYPKLEIFKEDTDKYFIEPSNYEFLAVDRKGVKCADETKESLFDQLSQISESHEYIVEFS